jgi:hypothetical protein
MLVDWPLLLFVDWPVLLLVKLVHLCDSWDVQPAVLRATPGRPRGCGDPCLVQALLQAQHFAGLLVAVGAELHEMVAAADVQLEKTVLQDSALVMKIPGGSKSLLRRHPQLRLSPLGNEIHALCSPG